MKAINSYTNAYQANQSSASSTKPDSPKISQLARKTAQIWLDHASINLSTSDSDRQAIEATIISPEKTLNKTGQKVTIQPLKALVEPNTANELTGRTPLHQAIAKDDTQALKTLLSHPNIDPNKVNKFGCTPLYDAVFEGDIEMIRALLNHPKTDPNLGDDEKSTPLHMAVSMSDYEVLALLLAHPQIVSNQKDSAGCTPLDEAVYLEDPQSIKILQDYESKKLKREGANSSTNAFQKVKAYFAKNKTSLVSGALAATATAVSMLPYATRYFTAEEA